MNNNIDNMFFENIGVQIEKHKKGLTNKEIPYGTVKAYYAWDKGRHLRKNLSDREVICDSIWVEDVKDFCNTLREGNVYSFILTEDSSDLMNLLHEFNSNGFVIDGCYTFIETNSLGEDEEVKGIKLSTII